jgi:hypothetical protein
MKSKKILKKKTYKKTYKKHKKNSSKRIGKRMSKRIGKNRRQTYKMKGGLFGFDIREAMGFKKSTVVKNLKHIDRSTPKPNVTASTVIFDKNEYEVPYNSSNTLSSVSPIVPPKPSIMSIFKSNKIQPEQNQQQQQQYNANNSTIPYFQTILTLFKDKNINNKWIHGNLLNNQTMLTRCSNETYNNASTKKAGDIDKFIPFLPIPENGLNLKIRVVCHSGVMRKKVDKIIDKTNTDKLVFNKKIENSLYDQNIWGIRLNTKVKCGMNSINQQIEIIRHAFSIANVYKSTKQRFCYEKDSALSLWGIISALIQGKNMPALIQGRNMPALIQGEETQNDTDGSIGDISSNGSVILGGGPEEEAEEVKDRELKNINIENTKQCENKGMIYNAKNNICISSPKNEEDTDITQIRDANDTRGEDDLTELNYSNYNTIDDNNDTDIKQIKKIEQQFDVYVSCLIRTWMTAICVYLPDCNSKIFNLIVSPYLKETGGGDMLGCTDNSPNNINLQFEIFKEFLIYLKGITFTDDDSICIEQLKKIKTFLDNLSTDITVTILSDILYTNVTKATVYSIKLETAKTEITLTRCNECACTIESIAFLPGINKPANDEKTEISIDCEPFSIKKSTGQIWATPESRQRCLDQTQTKKHTKNTQIITQHNLSRTDDYETDPVLFGGSKRNKRRIKNKRTKRTNKTHRKK